MDDVNMRSAQKKSRSYHHGYLPDALLVAAQILLDEGGASAVTVRAVARQANVGHSAPANHFKDRAALLEALATQIFQDVTSAVRSAIAAAPSSARGRLHAMAEVIIAYALRHPHRYRLLWRGENFSGKKSPAEAAGAVLYDAVKEILGPTAGSGGTSIDSHVIAAWSLIHGYVSLRLEATLADGQDEVSGDSRARAIVDVLIDGIGPSRDQ